MSDGGWYLLKSADRQVYGPVDQEEMMAWASEAKISPLDKISRDNRESWVRSPMIPELQMDWLIEMPDKYLYGPTNIGTLQEFLATGEIDGEVRVINCADASESRIADLPFFQASPHHARSAETTFVGTQYPSLEGDPEAGSRIENLEKQVLAYQTAIDQWEQAYERLRQQFIEATGKEPL